MHQKRRVSRFCFMRGTEEHTTPRKPARRYDNSSARFPTPLFLCYTRFMRYLIIVGLVLLASPLFAWDNPCYTGALPAAPFPQGNRSMVTLEARRVVSTQGNLMVYDLGDRKVIIKAEANSCQSFLKDVARGNCKAKGLVNVEPDKGTFSDAGDRFKALPPSAH